MKPATHQNIVVKTTSRTFAFSFLFLLAISIYTSAFASDLSHVLWDQLEAAHPSCPVDLKGSGALLEATRKSVDEVVAKRVASVVENKATYSLAQGHHPQIISNGTKIDITNALFLQYGPNIIGGSKEEIGVFANRLVDFWKIGRKTELNNFFTQKMGEFNAFKQSSLREGKTLASIENRMGVFPNPLMADGKSVFPLVADLASDASKIEEKLQVYSNALRARILDRVKSNNPYSIGDAKEIEVTLEVEATKFPIQESLNQLKDIGSEVASTFAERAAKLAELKAPTDVPGEVRNWAAYLTVDPNVVAKEWFEQAPKILEKILTTLRTQFPIEETSVKNLPEYAAQLNSMTRDFRGYVLSKVFSSDGLSLNIPSSKVYAKYDTDLATTVLMTDPNVFEAASSAPVLFNIHGAGTTRSSGQSFKSLGSIYSAYGFRSLAIDMPIAGLGPVLTGPAHTISFLDKAASDIKANYIRNKDVPLIMNGRSMGGLQAFLYDAMYGEKSNVDLYVAVSLSNPRTFKEQFKNVYDQLKAKLFSGVIQESIINAGDTAEKALDMLKAANKKADDFFTTNGNALVLKQGSGDADGGPTVVEDLQKFRDDYSPAAHLFIFHMPEQQRAAYQRMLKGEEVWIDTKDRNGNMVKRKITEEMLEGQHFIDSNSEDTPGFAYPKAQTLQSTALDYAFMDYFADGIGENHSWPLAKERESQRKFKLARAKQIEGTPYKSYLDWYIASVKINLDEVNAFTHPVQNTGNYAERMAYVKHWIVSEKVRVLKLYQSKGLIK